MRLRLTMTAAAAALTMLAAAAPGTASAATTARWRISYASKSVMSELSGVAAVSSRDVWAVGAVAPEGLPSSDRPVVERYNGRSWAAVALPRRYRHGVVLTAVAASSPTNVWVFGWSRNSKGLDPQTLAFHWNGTWSVRGDWHGYNVVNSAVTFSPRNVWIFGNDATLHYNGTRWTTWKMSFTVIQASAISSNDIWAVGVSNSTDQSVLARLHNGTWRPQAIPVSSSATTQTALFGVLARSDRDVWVTGGTRTGSTSHALALERLSGGRWVSRSPAISQWLGSVVPDGGHGMWATFELGPYDGARVDHYSGGRWRAVTLPRVTGKATSVTTLAEVPRSTTVFGAGLVLWGGLPETEGVVVKYSR